MNNSLTAIELLSIGYQKGLTAEEKTEAVAQLTARKEQQAKERQMGLGNPFLKMCAAYDSSTWGLCSNGTRTAIKLKHIIKNQGF